MNAPTTTTTLPAKVEVFTGDAPGTLNLTMALADAKTDDGEITLEWVQDVSLQRVKLWAQRDGKIVVTVELLFKDLLQQMADVALTQMRAAAEPEKEA